MHQSPREPFKQKHTVQKQLTKRILEEQLTQYVFQMVSQLYHNSLKYIHYHQKHDKILDACACVTFNVFGISWGNISFFTCVPNMASLSHVSKKVLRAKWPHWKSPLIICQTRQSRLYLGIRTLIFFPGGMSPVWTVCLIRWEEEILHRKYTKNIPTNTIKKSQKNDLTYIKMC